MTKKEKTARINVIISDIEKNNRIQSDVMRINYSVEDLRLECWYNYLDTFHAVELSGLASALGLSSYFSIDHKNGSSRVVLNVF